MATPAWIAELLDRADSDLVHGGYRAVSVDPERVRRQLRTAGRDFVDPGAPNPSLEQLDRTARWVIEQTRFKSTALGGFAGLAGAASVPPEVAGQGLGILRLAQRLVIVYGFDPHTDRGRTALWRALGAGLEVELPTHGPVGLRLSDLPSVLRPNLTPRSMGGALAQALLFSSMKFVAARFTRFVPLLSSGISAVDASRRTPAIGERMMAVLRRLSEPGALPLFEDVEEVPTQPKG